MKIGRNDPCHCGSGQKYKKCCAAADETAKTAELAAQNAARAADAAAAANESGGTTSAAGKAALRTNPALLPPKPKSPGRIGQTVMRRRAV